jgi:GNAT superfamily N-acetyltransferase
MAWERYRLDPRRNPYFDTGDAVYFLARRLGRPVGRIAAHVEASGAVGRFGFWCVDDDASVGAALVDAARAWLSDQGCASMEGPTSFTAGEEEGLLVEGHDAPGLTGRPWHPPSQAERLEAIGFEPLHDRRTWRLATTETGPERPRSDDAPGHAGSHGDPRLVLAGVAAVPDLSAVLRGARLRHAWGLAKRVRAGAWSTATIVRCDDDPVLAVPALLAAAGRAGYESVIAPWSPDPAALPETVHRTYIQRW